MKRISAKQAKELKKRAKLKQELIIMSRGRCMKCGGLPDFLGLQLSHTLSLARGGQTTPENCQVLCNSCHLIVEGQCHSYQKEEVN